MTPKKLLVTATVLAVMLASGATSAFAALLGVQAGYPQITFDSLTNPNPYGTNFDTTTGIFSVTAYPVSYVWASRKLVAITGSRSLTIQAHLDSSGNLVPDGTGDGIVISGDITPNATYTGPAYSGTLLTGKITRFGFYNGGTTDTFDFRFTPTGGLLYDQYKSHDIAVTLTSENSTFNDSFGTPFHGYAKGTVGTTPGPHVNLTQSCLDANAQEPIEFTATLANTGSEALNNVNCTASPEATLTGVPSGLPLGATATITGSYLPTASPSTGTLSCSATGSTSQVTISASASATCSVLLSPALAVTQYCGDAAAPGEPITVSAQLTNSGNETLTGFTCSDSQGAVLLGIPQTLAPGATAVMTGSYIPSTSGSTDTITCSAKGAIDNLTVSTTSSSTCNIKTAPAVSVAAACTNAPPPGLPIGISAVITNTGNETLSGFSCTDTQGATFSGIPATLAPGAMATITGSYPPLSSPATDTITCSANGIINNASISASSSATCGIDLAACIKIEKQVSTSCIVTGSKDKHCKSDESKDDHCKRGDADRGYCSDGRTKQTYCQEVTQKQGHCGSSETKSTHCSKYNCDRGYCDSDDSKDDYCKIPAAPVCVPVWVDADTLDTAATMGTSRKSATESGDDILARLTGGTLFSGSFQDLINKLKLAISTEGTDEGSVRDADREDDDDDKYDSSEYYQGHVKQSALMYRFIVSNCGDADLTGVAVNDPKIGVANYVVGELKAGATVTLTSAQIPQLAQPVNSCSQSFVNTVTVSGQDAFGKAVTATDDAWVLCNTKSCTFTQGYWKNHPSSWPVTALKLGSTSYTQTQLLAIFDTPVNGNGLISLAHQLIAAKLNVANGTPVPAAVQQAITSADAMIGALVVPPIGSGHLDTATTSSLTATLDSYNNGTFPGGPTHCGDTTPPQQCGGVIGDFVWNDYNQNGAQNSGEPGIAGVKVSLGNGKSTTTDSNGRYKFTELCPGTYTVKVTPPCGMFATTPTSISVTLTSGTGTNLAADFGMAKPAVACTGKIGDFVWKDLNKNGIQETTEVGMPGITVSLSNGSKTVTDLTGRYQFTGLCAGDYTVTVATPAGYSPSPIGQGTNTSKDSKGSPAKVTLTSSSSSVQNIDFGFFKTCAPSCTGVIGNYVWNDLNKNGIQDCGEKGIGKVTVKLSNGLTTITDADGHYQFSGLCAGTYTATALTPIGYTPSPTLQGSSRASDSNGSPTTSTLTDNRSSDLTIDFGFYKLPTPAKGSGCSLGYWKTHTANWPSASHTTDNFDTIFGGNAFTPDVTLIQALNLEGGGLYNLARQATAALLNAEDSRIKGYPMTAAEVKAAVLSAVLTGNYEWLASKLDSYNNLGCPLN